MGLRSTSVGDQMLVGNKSMLLDSDLKHLMERQYNECTKKVADQLARSENYLNQMKLHGVVQEICVVEMLNLLLVLVIEFTLFRKQKRSHCSGGKITKTRSIVSGSWSYYWDERYDYNVPFQ